MPSKLIEAALDVAASGYPVFPLAGKMPCWSNADLGVGQGQGGYKIATTDPDRIKELFAHSRADGIGVPMGEMSGLMCVDFDEYKSKAVGEWMADHIDALKVVTRIHKTGRGGWHFFYQHQPGTRWPSSVIDGIDIKASGTGYVRWVGSPGYELAQDAPIAALPAGLKTALLAAAPGKGTVDSGNWQPNDASDDELVRRIETASDFHASIRGLAMRLASRGHKEAECVKILQGVMKASVAASASHPRHDDWQQRFDDIERMVGSAQGKAKDGLTSSLEAPEMAELIKVSAPPDGAGIISAKTIERLVEAALPPKKQVPVPKAADEVIHDWDMGEVDIPERKWVVGTRAVRKNMSLLAGMGGTGKSSLELLTAYSVASGGTYTGEKVHVSGNVLIINNEDPRSEIQRRLVAMRKHLGIPRPQHKLHIFGAPEKEGDVPLIFAHKDEHGNMELNSDAFAFLEQYVIEHDILYVSIDPFISCIRGAVSNDNDAIAAVAERVRRVSFRTGCAINIVAHTKKSEGKNVEAMAGDQSAVRGAGALVDFARIVYTVVPMGEARARAILGGKTAKQHEVEALRAPYFRLDAAKGNLSRKSGQEWYAMESVRLDNGDEVGVPVYLGDYDAMLRHTGQVKEDVLVSVSCAAAIVEVMGIGEHRGLRSVFEKMVKHPAWRYGPRNGRMSQDFERDFAQPVRVGDVEVMVTASGDNRGSRTLIIRECVEGEDE
jgi:hypothetical protein